MHVYSCSVPDWEVTVTSVDAQSKTSWWLGKSDLLVLAIDTVSSNCWTLMDCPLIKCAVWQFTCSLQSSALHTFFSRQFTAIFLLVIYLLLVLFCSALLACLMLVGLSGVCRTCHCHCLFRAHYKSDSWAISTMNQIIQHVNSSLSRSLWPFCPVLFCYVLFCSVSYAAMPKRFILGSTLDIRHWLSRCSYYAIKIFTADPSHRHLHPPVLIYASLPAACSSTSISRSCPAQRCGQSATLDDR